MSDQRGRTLHDLLATYGADLSRWPERGVEAKAELLRDPAFRRAWEAERTLDDGLGAYQGETARIVERSGAIARLAQRVQRRAAGPLAGVDWRRVAAGVVVASMLGGALDLALEEPQAEPLDVALVDPVSVLDPSSE